MGSDSGTAGLGLRLVDGLGLGLNDGLGLGLADELGLGLGDAGRETPLVTPITAVVSISFLQVALLSRPGAQKHTRFRSEAKLHKLTLRSRRHRGE